MNTPFPDGRCSHCGIAIVFKSFHPPKFGRIYCSEKCLTEGEKENEYW